MELASAESIIARLSFLSIHHPLIAGLFPAELLQGISFYSKLYSVRMGTLSVILSVKYS